MLFPLQHPAEQSDPGAQFLEGWQAIAREGAGETVTIAQAELPRQERRAARHSLYGGDRIHEGVG